MSDSAGAPEPRLFFLSRSGADADVALAVARLLQEAGRESILPDENFTHQDFMAAMEQAFAAGDDGSVTVAFLSAGYLESPECRSEFRLACEAQARGSSNELVIFRIGDVAVTILAEPIGYIDFVPILSIEDDARRGRAFAATALGALGLSDEIWHRAYLHHADGSAAAPEGQAARSLREASGRADIALGAFARLANALAHEPLAFRLAARLLAERPGADVETYLEALSEHAAPVPAGTAYPAQLRAALLTSFEVVESDSAMLGHSATSLLALAAFVPSGQIQATAFRDVPEAYPQELAPFVADPVLRERALGLLRRLALISPAGQAGGYAVEQDICAIVRDLLAESESAEVWIETATRFGPEPVDDRPADSAGADSTIARDASHRSYSGSGDTLTRAPAVKPVAPAIERPSSPSRDAAFAAFERGEALAKAGRSNDALDAFETARAIFQALCDAAPENTQAQADLAASRAKIGLTCVSAGQASQGERWLKSCRDLIEGLVQREPENELWPRYLNSLDAQLADIGRAMTSPPPSPPKPAALSASTPTGADTVRRLVNALKEPSADPLDPPAEALNADEPPPLVIETERAPPKVFSDADDEPVALEREVAVFKAKRRILPLAVNGHGHDGLNGDDASPSGTLGPALDPLVPPRKAGFLKRLFGR